MVTCACASLELWRSSFNFLSFIVNVTDATRTRLAELFDGDGTTCVATASLFTSQEFYTARLHVSPYNGTMATRAVGFNVTFGAGVPCAQRKVVHILFFDVAK